MLNTLFIRLTHPIYSLLPLILSSLPPGPTMLKTLFIRLIHPIYSLLPLILSSLPPGLTMPNIMDEMRMTPRLMIAKSLL